MTYELLFYIFLCFVGASLCFVEIKSDKLYNIVVLLLFSSFFAVTRYAGFDIDMKTYVATLEYDAISVYYLREPVFWISSRFVYKVLKTPELTFLFYDIISVILVLWGRRKINLPQYFPFLFLLFFPSVMGFNNVYRQYLSYVLFFIFITFLMSKTSVWRKRWTLLFAILTHNASALFAPLYYAINDKKNLDFKFILSSVLVVMMLPFAISNKSISETGTIGVQAYIFVLAILIAFYCFSNNFRFKGMFVKLLYVLTYVFMLTCVSVGLMGGAQSKRVGMFALMIALVPISMTIENRYKHVRLIRFIVFVILTSATFLFSSALNMLLTR